ncbi:MAG: TIGR00159 family protein [Gloeocapsa sp. DLM2.Bin57]|nr:MAG: TIGR00159 family protein [Gloeocapsa sp. DLM2.Bin57]
MLLWGLVNSNLLLNLRSYLKLHQGIDLLLSVGLCLLLLVIIRDSRARWLIQGLIIIVVATFLSKQSGLELVSRILDKIVLGAIIVIAMSFQLELRRFLEKLGRGELLGLFITSQKISSQTRGFVDQLVEAVKELSQNRTGALIVIETKTPINNRILLQPGISLNADVSKELIQTIFQKKTLLHDGAMIIKNGRIASAGTILPLSERTAPAQYGTRHRAAMGITEQIEDILCIVVSEETGSISLAQKGILNRFLTSTALKEQLEAKLSQGNQDVRENWGRWQKIWQWLGTNLYLQFKWLKLKRWLKLPSSEDKK